MLLVCEGLVFKEKANWFTSEAYNLWEEKGGDCSPSSLIFDVEETWSSGMLESWCKSADRNTPWFQMEKSPRRKENSGLKTSI